MDTPIFYLKSKDIVDIIKSGHEAKAVKIAMNGLVIEYQRGDLAENLITNISTPVEQETKPTIEAPKLEHFSTEELMYIDPVAYEERLATEG